MPALDHTTMPSSLRSQSDTDELALKTLEDQYKLPFLRMEICPSNILQSASVISMHGALTNTLAMFARYGCCQSYFHAMMDEDFQCFLWNTLQNGESGTHLF
jgi:hypothetical protein